MSVELAKNLTYHSSPLTIRFRSHNTPLRRNLNFRRRHVFLETLEAGTTWRLQYSATGFSTMIIAGFLFLLFLPYCLISLL